MSRSVPEWIGKTDDTAIPPRVRLRVFDAFGGCCAHCKRKLGAAGESPEYDHIQALTNGGENRESNIQPLCRNCHKPKTKQDVAIKKKNNSVRAKHIGAAPKKRKMPYRKFNGDPVWQ